MLHRLQRFFAATVLACAAFTPALAFAQTQTVQSTANSGTVQLSIPIAGKQSVSGLPEYIVTVYQYALGIVTIVAVIMVIVGGFKYLLSASIPQVSDGKKIIQDAIGGMIILFLAYAILYTINPKTVRLSLPDIQQVQSRPITYGVNQCSQNSDCGAGRVCLQTASGGACIQDQLGVGTAVSGISCRVTTDCPAGSRCVNNHCATAPTAVLCTSNTDCGNGQVCTLSPVCCLNDACATIAGSCDAGRACTGENQCFRNKRVCRDVVTACVTDRNCPTNQRCIGQVCQISVGGATNLAPTATPAAPAPATAPGTTPAAPAPGSVEEFGSCETDAQCQRGLACRASTAGAARICIRLVP